MRWEIDLAADSMYVHVTEQSPRRQVELESGVVVDVDAEGHLCGVEVLRVSRGWSAEEVLERFEVERVDADSLKYLASFPSVMIRTSYPTLDNPSPVGSPEIAASATDVAPGRLFTAA